MNLSKLIAKIASVLSKNFAKKINRKKTISMTDPYNDTPAQPVWC